MKIRSLFSVCVLLSIFASAAFAKTTPSSISIMAYNVENLFDTVHDQDKEDWTYLPKAVKNASSDVKAYCKSLTNGTYRNDCYNIDWSDALLEIKVNQIGKVIKSVNNGNGPDIIVFEEVENLNALTILRDKALANMGYTDVILLEGPDTRGIDVGMISKFPLAAPAVLHTINLIDPATGKASSPTRGVLEAKFQVGDAVVGVLANHWPSQSHVDEMRVQAAKVMLNAVSNMKNVDVIVSAGDFNTLKDDAPNAIADHVVNANVGGMVDAEVERRKNFPTGLSDGTHWYRGEWASLDHIFVKTFTPSLCGGIQIEPDYKSFSIVTTADSVKDTTWLVDPKDPSTAQTFKNVPFRFDYKTGKGVADHLPIMMEFDLVKIAPSSDKQSLCVK